MNERHGPVSADPNLPIGKLTRIKDMLPPPEKLVMPEDTIKVTLLSRLVRFFQSSLQ